MRSPLDLTPQSQAAFHPPHGELALILRHDLIDHLLNLVSFLSYPSRTDCVLLWNTLSFSRIAAWSSSLYKLFDQILVGMIFTLCFWTYHGFFISSHSSSLPSLAFWWSLFFFVSSLPSFYLYRSALIFRCCVVNGGWQPCSWWFFLDGFLSSFLISYWLTAFITHHLVSSTLDFDIYSYPLLLVWIESPFLDPRPLPPGAVHCCFVFFLCSNRFLRFNKVRRRVALPPVLSRGNQIPQSFFLLSPLA